MKTSFQKPAYFKGSLWMLFSGTAMLSAFILPIHIWMLMDPLSCGTEGCVYVVMRLDEWWFKLYFGVLIFAALYHSFYRVKTILYDLKCVRLSKLVGWLLSVLFLVLMAGMVVSLWQAR